MSTDLTQQIKEMQDQSRISSELVVTTIEDMVRDAYERQFGTLENCEIEIVDYQLTVWAYKFIVAEDELEDPATQISYEDALLEDENCKIGDSLKLEIDLKSFSQRAINIGKQRSHQTFREIQKDSLYAEYKAKEGQLIKGYVTRERDGNLFVNVGNDKEGILPARYQSNKEQYSYKDSIRVLVYEVKKEGNNVNVVLSRTHPDFVKRICEIEIPEIASGIVTIERIAREPGYRTKIAVKSNRDNIEPVGVSVGQKGIRVQNIVAELSNEKVDILAYSPDPQTFVKNALSPAQINTVYILDREKKRTLAIVEDNQLALSIGKNGQNVRLANKLVDWSIEVKTESQAIEEGLIKDVDELSSDFFNQGEEIQDISELVDLDERVIEILKNNGIELIESLISLEEEELKKISGLTEENISLILKVIDDSIEIVDDEDEEEDYDDETDDDDVEDEEIVDTDADDDDSADDAEQATDESEEVAAEEESSDDADEVADEESDEQEISDDEDEEEIEYHCPECDAVITIDDDACPNCGIGLSFEEEDDEEDDEDRGIDHGGN